MPTIGVFFQPVMNDVQNGRDVGMIFLVNGSQLCPPAVIIAFVNFLLKMK